MNRTKIDELTVDELVDRFADIGVKQDRALLGEKNSEFRELFTQMNVVEDELKRRGPDARRALLRLYNHPNMQVRVKAAIRTLAVAPEPAKQALRAISVSRWFPQAADAGMILDGLADGSFVPK